MSLPLKVSVLEKKNTALEIFAAAVNILRMLLFLHRWEVVLLWILNCLWEYRLLRCSSPLIFSCQSGSQWINQSWPCTVERLLPRGQVRRARGDEILVGKGGVTRGEKERVGGVVRNGSQRAFSTPCLCNIVCQSLSKSELSALHHTPGVIPEIFTVTVRRSSRTQSRNRESVNRIW